MYWSVAVLHGACVLPKWQYVSAGAAIKQYVRTCVCVCVCVCVCSFYAGIRLALAYDVITQSGPCSRVCCLLLCCHAAVLCLCACTMQA